MPVEGERLAEAERSYLENEELQRLARESARTEAAGYCRSTRIQEIMDFARRIGATRLGIAHCIGLLEEAKVARDIFRSNGFEVHAICCKVGSIEKGKISRMKRRSIPASSKHCAILWRRHHCWQPPKRSLTSSLGSA